VAFGRVEIAACTCTPAARLRVWGCLATLTVIIAGTHVHAQQRSHSESAPCDEGPIDAIPRRASDAPAGSEFARRVEFLSGLERDAQVREELLSGNVPHFLRRLAPVTVASADSAHPIEITVCVLPDYLAVGSDADFVFVPLGLEAALDVAGRLGFGLPTPKLVDAIYEESAVKLAPQPLPAGDRMRSTDYFVHHTQLIAQQRSALGVPLGELTAGDKKDLVLTSRLWEFPGRVAIYGWHRAVNEPIQPLSTVHGARYADYSHGVRLVSRIVYVNGVKRSIDEVLGEPRLAPLLTKEGPLTRTAERLRALMARLAGDRATATGAWLHPVRDDSPARR
jgi:hypothetical protein